MGFLYFKEQQPDSQAENTFSTQIVLKTFAEGDFQLPTGKPKELGPCFTKFFDMTAKFQKKLSILSHSLTSSFKEIEKNVGLVLFCLLSPMKCWNESLKALQLEGLNQSDWQNIKSHCFFLPNGGGGGQSNKKEEKRGAHPF